MTARGNPADLTGQRFGELTVEAEVERTRRGIVWLCRCDCGGVALRTTAALRASVRNGQTPSCRRCHRELCSGLLLDRHAQHVAAWKDLWAKHGTLYTDAALDRIERDIRDEVVERLGPLEEYAALPVEVVDHGIGCEDDKAPTYEEIGAALGIHRSRAQQLLQRALRNFERRWKRMYPKDPLPWILFGTEPKRFQKVVAATQIDAAIEATKRAA